MFWKVFWALGAYDFSACSSYLFTLPSSYLPSALSPPIPSEYKLHMGSPRKIRVSSAPFFTASLEKQALAFFSGRVMWVIRGENADCCLPISFGRPWRSWKEAGGTCSQEASPGERQKPKQMWLWRVKTREFRQPNQEQPQYFLSRKELAVFLKRFQTPFLHEVKINTLRATCQLALQLHWQSIKTSQWPASYQVKDWWWAQREGRGAGSSAPWSSSTGIQLVTE